MTAAITPGRILVIRRRYVGDIVLLEPFLRNLKEAYPRARLTLVVDRGYGDVLASCPFIDEIAELPTSAGSVGDQVRAWRAFLSKIALRSFDLAFDFARNERALVTLVLSRARRRVSFEVENDVAVRRRRPSDIRRRRRMTTDLVHTTAEEIARIHQVDFNNRLLAAIDVPTPHRVPHLPVAPDDAAEARRHIEAALGGPPGDGPLVLVHPGGRTSWKLWPTERFARVLDTLEREHGAQPLLLAGPGEEDLVDSIRAERASRSFVLPSPLPIGVLAGVAQSSTLFLGNDSAPAHIAAAVGTPTCVLFNDTSVQMWRTLGPNDVSLQADVPCGQACIDKEACADGTRRVCVRRIPCEDVEEALRTMLQKLARPADRPPQVAASSSSG